MRHSSALVLAALFALLPRTAPAQGLTGTLIGTVKDAQGGVIPGAEVRVSSPALTGGPMTLATNERGQFRFQTLPPGRYTIDIELRNFAGYHESDLLMGAGATVDRTPVLRLAALAESLTVQGAGSHLEARDSGFSTRVTSDDLRIIPTRRTSMFDAIRGAPGISPTSPSSATATTVSAFGSGTNENQFLIDGTNFTCPCNGVARAEPGIDFIQEVQVQSVGASAEYGNVQGAVINVVTRQGGDRFQHDSSYYTQTAGLTSAPVVRPLAAPGTGQSGYERARYRDLTMNVGGPVLRDRLWFFAGYQYLRDYDGQPGTDPAFPRTYEQNKVFAKLTWKLTPRLQLLQSFHDEHWVNPEQPTLAKPYVSTLRTHASVPAITFGHLTHTLSPNTVWDARAGRFVHDRVNSPSTRTAPASHFDRLNSVFSGGPQEVSGLTLIRTTVKATLNHYAPSVLGGEHEWKIGAQWERGQGRGPSVIPTGVRYVDNGRDPYQAISASPSMTGGEFLTSSAFATDAVTVGDRITINAGVRFDHSRAISPDLHAVDAAGDRTSAIVRGLGTLYTWNVWSPRLGVTARLTGDGRTLLRGSYGRFSQGVLTGEFSGFHPGVMPTTTMAFDPATGGYTRLVSVVNSNNLLLDANTRPPHTDEYSMGVDRELRGGVTAAVAYVHKSGGHFIGWTDVGGQYGEDVLVKDGRAIPVFELDTIATPTSARRFLLTNQERYSMRYDGLVMVAERRRSQGWQASGSYTFSRASGLQASSGANAAAPQSSSVALPSAPFGRDPNELTNAYGRLPNDRPHMFHAVASMDVPRTGVVVAANLQYFSGKPWAAATQATLPQGDVRILLEPRGTRRLSSQSLLDVRLSRTIAFGALGHAELMIDVLNALNDRAEESIATDILSSPNFGQPTVFMDPRRAMIGVRINLGR